MVVRARRRAEQAQGKLKPRLRVGPHKELCSDGRAASSLPLAGEGELVKALVGQVQVDSHTPRVYRQHR